MINKLTKDVLDKIIYQLNKPENKEKLDNEIITPIFCSLNKKLYPYISLLFIMYIINLILIVIILILIIIYNKTV